MPKKCVFCKQIILKEEEELCTPYKNRLAHNDCFKSAMKLIKEDKDQQLEKQRKKKETQNKINGRGKSTNTRVPKAELKDGMSDEEYKEKQGYYSTIKTLTGIEKLPAKVYAISERDKDKYNWSWTGMKNTLIYLYDIKEKQLTTDCAGLIVYYYDEAQNFYEEVKRVEENNKDVKINKIYSERVVRISPPKRKIKQLNFDD